MAWRDKSGHIELVEHPNTDCIMAGVRTYDVDLWNKRVCDAEKKHGPAVLYPAQTNSGYAQGAAVKKARTESAMLRAKIIALEERLELVEARGKKT